MTLTSNWKNNTGNGFPKLKNGDIFGSCCSQATVLLRFTLNGGHLGFFNTTTTAGRHLGSHVKNKNPMTMSISGPKMVLVEQCEQLWYI